MQSGTKIVTRTLKIFSPVCLECGTIKKSGKRSCCARGGAWFKNCGDVGDTKSDHTWAEGIQACKSGKWRERVVWCVLRAIESIVLSTMIRGIRTVFSQQQQRPAVWWDQSVLALSRLSRLTSLLQVHRLHWPPPPVCSLATRMYVWNRYLNTSNSDRIVVGVFGVALMPAWSHQHPELRVHRWHGVVKDVLSAVPPKNPASTVVVSVAVIGSRAVAMPATHNSTIRGLKAQRLANQVSRVFCQWDQCPKSRHVIWEELSSTG